MRARSSMVSLLATMALSQSADPLPYFTLESSGAVSLAVTSGEARYGIVPDPRGGRPVLSISLGATKAEGSLSLFTDGEAALRPGRYRVSSSLPEQPTAERWFHPCFVAGTVERPRGFFHGESGWVTITSVEQGRITGEYQIRARGFLAPDLADENQWVTIRGTFSAEGESETASAGGGSSS